LVIHQKFVLARLFGIVLKDQLSFFVLAELVFDWQSRHRLNRHCGLHRHSHLVFYFQLGNVRRAYRLQHHWLFGSGNGAELLVELGLADLGLDHANFEHPIASQRTHQGRSGNHVFGLVMAGNAGRNGKRLFNAELLAYKFLDHLLQLVVAEGSHALELDFTNHQSHLLGWRWFAFGNFRLDSGWFWRRHALERALLRRKDWRWLHDRLRGGLGSWLLGLVSG
jgi:hypothetical protein